MKSLQSLINRHLEIVNLDENVKDVFMPAHGNIL